MYRLTDEEFERTVEAALEAIPGRFIEAMENVVITVADEPDDEQGPGDRERADDADQRHRHCTSGHRDATSAGELRC